MTVAQFISIFAVVLALRSLNAKTIYVDPRATPPGVSRYLSCSLGRHSQPLTNVSLGDGSPSFPFPTILQANSSAVSGDIIELADTLFPAKNNANILFTVQNITIQCSNGTAVIDCETGL
jgi:hypothetical protein